MVSGRKMLRYRIFIVHILFVILILFSASILFYQNFFYQGVLAYVDMTFSMPLERLLDNYLQSWYPWGSFGNLSNLSRGMFSIPFLLMSIVLDLPFKVYLLSIFIVIFSVAGISMYFLVVYLQKQGQENDISTMEKSFISLICALVYMYNPWSLGHFWTFFMYPSYALLPLILLLTMRVYNKFLFRRVIILSIICSIGSTSPHGILWIFFLTVAYGLYTFLIGLGNYKNLIKVMLLTFFIYFMINSYWILPYVSTLFSGTPVKPSYVMTSQLIDFLSQNNSILNSLRFVGGWGFPINPNFVDNLWIILSISLPFFAFLSILLWKKRKELIFFSLMGVISLFLALGTSSSPFPQLYKWVALNSPISNVMGWVFRGPDRWLSIGAVAYSVMIGYTLLGFINTGKNLKNTKLRFIPIMVTVITPLIVLSSFFLLSNAYSKQVFNPTEIPRDYSDLNEWLEKQLGEFKVLWLPIAKAGGYNFSWASNKRMGPINILSSGKETINSMNNLFDTKSLLYLLENDIIPHNRIYYLSKLIRYTSSKYIIADSSIKNSESIINFLKLNKDTKLVYQTNFLKVYQTDKFRDIISVPQNTFIVSSIYELLFIDANIPYNNNITYIINPSFKLGEINVYDLYSITTNLVENPSFENKINNYRLVSGTNFSLNIVNDTQIKGQNSLRLSTNINSTHNIGWVFGQNNISTSDEDYLIRSHMRWNNSVWSHIVVQGFNNQSNKWEQILHCPGIQSGSSNWKEWICIFHINKNIEKIKLVLAGGWVNDVSKGNATTWFDDIEILKINKSELHNFLINQSSPVTGVYYRKVNSEEYKVQINTSKPFMLSFAESYDPLWVAKIKQPNGKWKEYSPVPLYSVINGFWINETGNLDITIEYKPQRWFYIGSIISLTTLLLCITYLIYDWRRNRKQKTQFNQKTLQKEKGFSEGLEKLTENKIKSRFVNYFKKYFKKPPSDLKTQILIKKAIQHRLDKNETIEMLIDIGYDKAKARYFVNQHFKKRSKEQQLKLR